MSKTLFEKLAFAGKKISLQQSVINNIRYILRARQFLDGEQSVIDNPPGEIVDLYSGSSMDAENYSHRLKNMILKFEPRIEDVEVTAIKFQDLEASCRLKIVLADISLEHDFNF